MVAVVCTGVLVDSCSGGLGRQDQLVASQDGIKWCRRSGQLDSALRDEGRKSRARRLSAVRPQL